MLEGLDVEKMMPYLAMMNLGSGIGQIGQKGSGPMSSMGGLGGILPLLLSQQKKKPTFELGSFQDNPMMMLGGLGGGLGGR